MVSIPSSQIKHILYYDIATQKQNLKPKRNQPTTKSIIKEAENEGYFTILNVEFLNENFNRENIRDPSENVNIDRLKLIRAVCLHARNIQRIEYLEYCRNLIYLDLSKNFISDFTSLRLCQRLICLDLSSNLIETLPEFSFWSNLTKLKVLYLHDNPIADPDTILGLSGSSSLTVITLWDTPLALKRKYRHFIVNSIWSLKVLDHHIVSDEEIIEDADFQNSYFQSVNDKLKINSYRTYDRHTPEEIEIDLKHFIVEINKTISHLSPVLIIQRWIKGFLIRKRLASRKIVQKRNTILPTIPKSPVEPRVIETSVQKAENDNIKYLKIDLIHLNKISVLENMDKESSMSSFVAPTFNLVTYRSISKLDYDKCSPEHISRALKCDASVIKDSSILPNDSEEKISFRFRGSKPVLTRNPNLEMLSEKNRSNNFIREADRIYHEKVLSELPEIKSKPVKKMNSSQLFRKVQGCMGLFLLNKWDKTENEIKKIEKLHENMNKVQTIKNEKMLNQMKISERKLKELALIKANHFEHDRYVERSQENEKKNQKKITEELKTKKDEITDKKSKVAKEMEFSQVFRSKQTAACKAVDKFEQMTYQQEQLQINRHAVEEAREKMKLEMETVKAYLEKQVINRRAEKNIEHSTLDLQILQQTNSRMNDAKMRVEKLKAIRRLVSCPQIPVADINTDFINKR